jgi:hypothetical protein
MRIRFAGKAPALLGALLMLAGALPAAGQESRSRTPGAGATRAEARVAVEVFLGRDRNVIRDYYRLRPGELPPGLAKRGGNLPPGLQKQLRRKGHLPPGLDREIIVFPVELERQLPPLKAGLVRGIIGGRAVIYNPRTSVILDVFTVF